MVEPTGYTALDLIGFTDRGAYDPNEYYVKNDLVHDGDDNIWRVLIDDTHGVTPAEGIYYTIFIRNQADAAKRIIAPIEVNPAANAHAVDTQLIYNNVLYDVTTAIAANDPLIIYPDTGYNLKAAPLVTSQIQALTNDKQDKTLSSAVTIDGVSKTTVESAISGIAPVVDKVSKSANEYNTSTSYKKGDYCTHDGKLYRCNTDCSGAWASNCWDEDTLINAVNQLNNPFNFYGPAAPSVSRQSMTFRADDNAEVSNSITLSEDSLVLGIVDGNGTHSIYYGKPTPDKILIYPGIGHTGFTMLPLEKGTVVKGYAAGTNSRVGVSAIPLKLLFKTIH